MASASVKWLFGNFRTSVELGPYRVAIRVPGPQGPAGANGKDGAAGPNIVEQGATLCVGTEDYLLSFGPDNRIAAVDPATFEAAGSMADHIAAINPHSQYSLTGHTHSAADIVSGTIAVARLPSTVARTDGTPVFTTPIRVPSAVPGVTGSLTIESRTSGEPVWYIGLNGTTNGLGIRSNGVPQFKSISLDSEMQIGPAVAPYGIQRATGQFFDLGESNNPGTYVFSSRLTGTAQFTTLHRSASAIDREHHRQEFRWIVSTDAIRRPEVQRSVTTPAGRLPTIREYAAAAGQQVVGIAATASPADADMVNGELSFGYAGGTTLTIKVKDSSGVVRTGTITLS
jgi:hypothetical protein